MFIKAFLNLCLLLCNEHRYQEAINLMTNCLEKNQFNTDVMMALGNIHLKLGNLEKANLIFSSANKALPDDLDIKYCLSAASGELAPHSSPLNFVKDLFNEYSSSYNSQMQNFLEYRSPVNLYAQILRHETHGFDQILDLGCGTGLVGKEFNSCSQSIDGVDISENMLKEADHTKFYRSLYLDEIQNHLKSTRIFYDLVICADTLIYFGSLHELFFLIHKVLSRRGYFLFTVENAEEGQYFLKPTKRYGHAISYLIDLSKKLNFDILEFQKSIIRKENSSIIHGYNILMQKN
jgi:predicted TPR repeat methyltransferase